MRSHSLLPVTIAVGISVLSWLSGCGPEDPATTGSPSSSSSSGAGGDGSSGNGGGGAGGAVVPIKNDKCPGEEVTLNLGDSKIISATTDGANDDLTSACSGAGGPDVVYAVTLAGNGTFKAKATSGADGKLNPALYLQAGCGDDNSTAKCVDFGTAKVEVLSLELAANTYYLVVDGGAGTAGDFDLTLSLAAPTCGDHVLSAGESCDPPGPGCDMTCQLQAAPAAQDLCPALGNAFTVPAAGLTIPEHFTTGFKDDYQPTGCATKGTAGADRVYQLVTDVGVNGMMTVKIGYDMDGTTPICDQDPENPGCFDRVLYMRTICDDDTTEVTCANAGVYSPESITFPVTQNKQYYVFVDGASATSFGTYTLFVSVQ